MEFTIDQFNELYPDDDSCLKEILSNVTCPSCKKGTKFTRIKGRKVFVCKCSHRFSPLAETIFHKSTTPLKKWFYAIYLFSISKNGVSAAELQRHIGVTYKTAWRMCNRIRLLFADEASQLNGVVEIDEAYIGGRGWNRRYVPYQKEKECLFGMVERGGRLRVRHVPNNGTRTLTKQIEEHIDKKAKVISDESTTYKNLYRRGYDHESVLHKKHYVDGDIYTNNIENFWSQLKRSLHGTHHSVSPKYLQNYADEFAFRYSHRDHPNLFSLIVQRAAKHV